ncbi:MAG: T9SS type A sorting domain-containing protein, partial [Chitinophagaceae bacterium]
GLTVDNIGTYTVKYTDLNGCVSTTNAITVSGAPTDNLYVYPNPNNGQFHVRFYNSVNEEVTIRIFDAKGTLAYQRKVQTTTAYTNIDIDLGDVRSAGVYLVKIYGSEGRLLGTRRIIVGRR